jgi:hypothetical protein
MFKPGHASVPSNAFGSAPDAAVTEAGVEVSFDGGANRNRQATSAVVVTNRELVAGNTLEISFANGRDGSWFALAPNSTITVPVMTHRMRLRGTSGAVALYSVMGIIS